MMRFETPYGPAEGNLEGLKIEVTEAGTGYKKFVTPTPELSPFLHNRYIEFNSEKEDEKLKEIFEEISRVKDQAEEALVIQVLNQLLKRNPGVEDFKKVTMVFGPPDKNPQGILKKYTLVYSDVTLGVVLLEMLPGSKGRFIFYPDKAFK